MKIEGNDDFINDMVHSFHGCQAIHISGVFTPFLNRTWISYRPIIKLVEERSKPATPCEDKIQYYLGPCGPS